MLISELLNEILDLLFSVANSIYLAPLLIYKWWSMNYFVFGNVGGVALTIAFLVGVVIMTKVSYDELTHDYDMKNYNALQLILSSIRMVLGHAIKAVFIPVTALRSFKSQMVTITTREEVDE